MNLSHVLDGLVADAAEHRLDPPEGWTQGRTLFGGLTAALCVRAARRTVPALAPLRSAQIAFVAPAAGDVRLRATVLRQGRSTSVVNVDCLGGDALTARALLTFGADRDSRVAHDRVGMPDVPPPEACSPFGGDGPRPAFFANFELRRAGGALPLSRDPEPEFLAWARFREGAGADPECALLTVADTLPPASMVAFEERAPISTMSWMIDLAQPVVATGWYLLHATSEQAGGGYARQAMTCWEQGGRCLALGRQTVAVFA